MKINPFVCNHLLCSLYIVVLIFVFAYCSTHYYERNIPVKAQIVSDTNDPLTNRILITLDSYNDYLKLCKYRKVVITTLYPNGRSSTVYFSIDSLSDNFQGFGPYSAWLKSIAEKPDLTQLTGTNIKISIQKEKTLLLQKILGIQNKSL